MINVVCVKSGTKYNAEHVNRLYRMVKRNLDLPFQFYCLTENPEDLYPEIQVYDISEYTDSEIKGFWPKICVFDPTVYNTPGNVLYLDIDVVIHCNITHYFNNVNPQKIKICFVDSDTLVETAAFNIGYNYNTEVNSSIMFFHSNNMKKIYDRFMANPYFVMNEYKGVCRYLWHTVREDLEFLEVMKDYYSTYGVSVAMKHKRGWGKYRFERVNGEWINNPDVGLLHAPHIPFCILNGVTAQDDLWECAEELFLEYYK